MHHSSCAPFPPSSTQPSSSSFRSRVAPPAAMASLLPYPPSPTVPRCNIMTACEPVSRTSPHFSAALFKTVSCMLTSRCPLVRRRFLLFPCGNEIAACEPWVYPRDTAHLVPWVSSGQPTWVLRRRGLLTSILTPLSYLVYLSTLLSPAEHGRLSRCCARRSRQKLLLIPQFCPHRPGTVPGGTVLVELAIYWLNAAVNSCSAQI